MQQVSATRSELLARRAQIGLAAQGRDLLKEWRSALVNEFNRLGTSALASIDALDRDAANAGRLLGLAVAAHGPGPVESAAFAAQGEVELSVRTRSVAGIPNVEIEAAPVARARTGSWLQPGRVECDASLAIDGLVGDEDRSKRREELRRLAAHTDGLLTLIAGAAVLHNTAQERPVDRPLDLAAIGAELEPIASGAEESTRRLSALRDERVALPGYLEPLRRLLPLAWRLLARFPADELKRIPPELVEHYEARA